LEFRSLSQNLAVRERQAFRYFSIAIAFSVAELSFAYSGRAGILLYLFLSWILVLNGYKAVGRLASKTYICLILVPLIRIVSVALPISNLPVIYWFVLISIPLFLSTFTTARLLSIFRFDPGIVGSSLPGQLAVGCLGVIIGWAGSLLNLDKPFLFVIESQQMWLSIPTVIICTGFLEELIFRGIIYRTVEKEIGVKRAIVLVSALNASLYLSNLSITQFFYVFAAMLVFSVVYARQRSLIGVSLAHGLLNITLALNSKVLLTSTVTAATWTANVFNTALIDLVGETVIFTLIFLLMFKEYFPQRLQSSPIEKQKAGFLLKLPDLLIPSFLFVFSYIIVVHALKFIP